MDKHRTGLTTDAMTHDRQKCLNAGCNDYATKPIDRTKLLRTIAHYVSPAQTSEPTDLGSTEQSPTIVTDSATSHSYVSTP
jgi:DNA-binding response OmpR family regulator